MSDFTRVKWEADALYGDHFAVFANSHVIADCFSNEANARLIAAAPEMYELLNKAYHILGKDTEISREISECIFRADGINRKEQ